jgi:hypothetical protein
MDVDDIPVAQLVLHRQSFEEETMRIIKTSVAVALAVATLTTVAATGKAFAKGSRGIGIGRIVPVQVPQGGPHGGPSQKPPFVYGSHTYYVGHPCRWRHGHCY